MGDSYLQHPLQLRTGGFFVLVEGVGVDVQRGGGLAVAENASYCCHIRAACNHQTGGGVTQAVDVELLRQTVLFQDALEPPCEGGGRHGQVCTLTSEQEVISRQFSFIVGLGNVLALRPVLPQKAFHFSGEVDVPVAGAGLGFFYEYFVAGDFYRVAADVNGALFPVNVTPLQSAALTPPHPCGDDKFEVRFVLDAFILQRGDDFLRRFLIRNLFLCFLTCVAIGAPRGVMRKKATLHGIGEDAAQRRVHALNGAFGERLSGCVTFCLTQVGIEFSEVLGSQIGELVVPKHGKETFQVLPVPMQRGLGQLAGSNVPQPQLSVLRQHEVLLRLRIILAGTLEQDGLLVEPLLGLLGRQRLRRSDGFLLGLDAVAVIVVAHGDHDEIAVAALANTCHDYSPLLLHVLLRFRLSTQHTPRGEK